MISIRDLGHQYRSSGGRPPTEALSGVTFECAGGEILGLVGPNGAGKSTLLNILAGFIRPTRGSISVEGLAPPKYRSVRGVGYVPEIEAIPPHLTVRELLRIGAGLGGGADAEVEGSADRMSLADRLDTRLDELSKGLRRRASVAYALVGAPKLLILDEPTDGLDPPSIDEIRKTVRRESEAGTTVILSSHNLAEVERLADGVVILVRGSVHSRIDLARIRTGTSRIVVTVAPEPSAEASRHLSGDGVTVSADRIEVEEGSEERIGPILRWLRSEGYHATVATDRDELEEIFRRAVDAEAG